MRQLMFPWLQGGNAGGFHNNYASCRYLRAPALDHRFPVTGHAYCTLHRHHAPEKTVCWGMWGRGKGKRGLGKFGLTEYKRDKTKRQKYGKSGNRESVPQQIWRDIPNNLWQVREMSFVARTAHDGIINLARFIVSAQNNTDCLSICCFKLIDRNCN